jgi:hypothetical protein
MIPKSGHRFSEKIVLNKEKLERDDDSKKVIPLRNPMPNNNK